MPAGDETIMSPSAPPAQAGIQDQSDNGNTDIRTTGESSRGSVIGGDASAKTAMGGGGGSSGGGGGGGGGGGYSLGASVAGTQTLGSGTSGDSKVGSAGIRTDVRTGPSFGSINIAAKGATASTGLTGTTIALIVGALAVVGIALAFILRKKG